MKYEVVTKAARVASAAHKHMGQVRKYTGEPYIVHPAEVVALVARVPHDPAMLAAAWLHDVVEDTPVTANNIRRAFGADIGQLVQELTDVSRPEDGNRRVRKQKDLEHTRRASPRAKTIKLADLINNARSIVVHDMGFAKVFIAEMRALLEVLTEGDQQLYAAAWGITDYYQEVQRDIR